MILEHRPDLLLPLAQLTAAGILAFSSRVRKEIIRRQGNRCDTCGDHARLQIHHRRPLSCGGGDEIENGVGLCIENDCHAEADRLALYAGIIYPQRHWEDGYYPNGRDDTRITNSTHTQ